MSQVHRDYFNDLAPEWNEKMSDDPITFRAYLSRFGVVKGDRVLDVGAGTGRMSKHLAEIVGHTGLVISEDISECMLAVGKRLIGSHRIQFICDDICALSLKTNTFDKVLCFSAFPHFIDPLRALKEMYRVLRPGGKLLILHNCCSKQLNEFHANLDGIVCKDFLLGTQEMVPILHQAGFECKDLIENKDLYWVEAIKPIKIV
jgi:ubiquinone/menaquinone biosynthesis C-methylase UbiE